MTPRILIVDDKKSVLTALEMLLQTEFDNVFTLTKPGRIISEIRNNNIDIVLLDMNFRSGINNGNEGIFWLNEILKHYPALVVIMITAYGDVELAVRAVKEGAFNFILKPWDNNKLMSTVHSAVELRKSRIENSSLRTESKNLKKQFSNTEYELLGNSEPMRRVLKLVQKVAPTGANVLITGENGTGKELIAREIHRQSGRCNEVFLSVDLGAVSETLFESELFGHKKGAFTDAYEDRTGKFETANGGTLFLDEIANIPLSLQKKILSALQTRTITKVGDNKPVEVDIRLISATNSNIDELVQAGRFREDLLYRINTIHIELPPLRQRGDDIILLAKFFLEKYSKKYNKKELRLSEKVKEKLMKHNWPGNVRELQHTIEKAVILSDSGSLTVDSFSIKGKKQTGKYLLESGLTLEDMEKEMILSAIGEENSNMSNVARRLGITRQTLYNKIKKYGI
ncbi:MAG: sigma-54-dependent Fis family transcriptional regulator [Chlorobi bacterium]|nr:sigma-54-dependent Fis family transcriptional regulator [Chlorobiota bacterium]